jgi:hypothetical protein
MKRIRDASPLRQFVPGGSGNPAAAAQTQRLIDGMAAVDTSLEEQCVRDFQRSATMPNPAVEAAGAQLVLCWCADNGLFDPFRLAAKAYDACAHEPEVNRFRGEGVELEFELEHITPENLEFFIRVLPHCPQIKGIELPIQSTPGQAERLADALAHNQGLNRLELYASDEAPPDSGTLDQLFSHPTRRVKALSELIISLTHEPDGNAAWMPALCNALSTHLHAKSVWLTLPSWSAERLRLLGDAIRANPSLSSLTLCGPIADSAMLKDVLADALRNQACKLTTLSLPDATFDAECVNEVIMAIRANGSLVSLDLGDTPLSIPQREAIDGLLQRNREAAKHAFLVNLERV